MNASSRRSWCRFAFAVAFLPVAALPVAARAADEWTVTTADFQTVPAAVRGLGADGVALDGRTVPMGQFVSLQRRTPAAAGAAPRFTLALAGGDRLAGSPAGVAGESLTWDEPVLGAVPVPFGRLVAIGRGREAGVPDEPPKQDVATLANGDVVRGVFTDATKDAVVIQTDAGPTAVPVGNLVRLAFAPTGGPGRPAAGFRVRLVDGSLITVADCAIDGDAVRLTLPGKAAKAVRTRLANLAAVEQLNGPVAWLSSLTPTENVQQPYFGGAAAWPARFDRAVDGSPLMADGKVVEKGIGVHAYSRLGFDVGGGGWASFRTRYAIDSRREDPQTLADVTVRVKVDGRTVYEKADVRVGPASPVVTVDLAGAKTLTLECDYGPAGDVQGRLDWLEPALLRAPAAAAATTTQPATGPTTRP